MEDSSAMLVSDELTSDWTQITQGISEILEQVSEVPQDSQDMQNFLQNLTEAITENKNVPEQTQKQTDVEADPVTDTSAVTVSQDESVPVTVEVSNESGQSDAFAQDSQTGSQPAAEPENSLPAFVDRLTQAFEPGTENAEIRQVSMQEIVDQVVNHILHSCTATDNKYGTAVKSGISRTSAFERFIQSGRCDSDTYGSE